MNISLLFRTCGGVAVALLVATNAIALGQTNRTSAAALKEDLRFVVDTIERLHPDMAHSVDRADLTRTVRQLERSLDRPMNRDEAWAALSRLNPVLADGHLLIGFPDWRAESREALKAGASHFPFEVAVDERGDLRIAAALGGESTPLAGSRIRRINGVDARSVVRELLSRAHGDTLRFRAALLSQRWWFFYRKLYGTPDRFELVFDGADPSRITVPASRAMPSVLQRDDEFDRLFRFERLPGDSALLTIGAFNWPDKARYFEFTRMAFAELRAKGVKTLIIDVRANGGGDDDMWKEGILRYIADRPYRTGSRYVKRVVEPYRNKDEVTGELVSGTIDSLVQSAPDDPLHFNGSVYVLIGAQTYSSAVLFGNVVRDHGFGVLAGEGGAVRSRQSGSVQTATLPNTGLILSYPRFVLTRPSGSVEPLLLMPDVSIEEDKLRSRSAVDALLLRIGGRAGQ